jgi:hypothetical protein
MRALRIASSSAMTASTIVTIVGSNESSSVAATSVEAAGTGTDCSGEAVASVDCVPDGVGFGVELLVAAIGVGDAALALVVADARCELGTVVVGSPQPDDG